MMWFSILTLFIFFHVTLGNDYKCSEGLYEPAPYDVPVTIEDLKRICPEAKKYHARLESVESSCREEGIEISRIPNLIKGFRRIIDDLCDENSLLHAAVAENAECLGPMLQPRSPTKCEDRRAEVLPVITETEASDYDFESFYYRQPTEEDRKARCVNVMFDLACLVNEVTVTCGNVAGKVISQGIRQIHVLHEGCTPEKWKQVLEDVGNLNIDPCEKGKLLNQLHAVVPKLND